MTISENIFARIDSVRKARGISVADFTEKMGYKTKSVYYQVWKETPENIKLKHIVRASEILECSTDYLLGLSDEIKIA